MKKLELDWLSPIGEFVPCGTYEHLDMARKLVVENGEYEYDEDGFRL